MVMKMNNTESWRKHYPYIENTLQIGGLKYNYVDEGKKDSPVVIMLHGNPTWSFYYRNVVEHLKTDYRCIVPDHIGCGLSDKPQDYTYTLEDHISNVLKLIEYLEIKEFSLIVHDWGGAIGMGVATRLKERVKNITLLNTAAYRSQDIPFSISICKLPFIGEKIVRHFNGFAWPATFMAVETPLSSTVKAGYLAPYNNYTNRIATARFVKDIPLTENHVSYQTLKEIEESLKDVGCPKQFLWGKKDFCFNDKFLKRWKEFYPNSKYVEYEDAGHYVIEDKRAECLSEIRSFLDEHSQPNC